MSNSYSNQGVQSVVWAEISKSECSQDFLDFMMQFPDPLDTFWTQALERAVTTFSPKDPTGEHCERKYAKAFEAVEAISRSSDNTELRAIACFHVGKMYHLGFGVAWNREQSINYYKKAIGLGDARALINCGGHYEGFGASPEDLEFADKLYERALAQGEPMGLACQADRIEGHESPEKYRLFLQAADLGLPYALHRIGAAHYLGTLGQSEDEPLGVSWLQRAGRAGSAESCRLLGRHYERDDQNRTRNDELAVEWQILGAKLGDKVCMRSLGFRYLGGIDVVKDRTQADYWLLRAAVLGDELAQYHMGQTWITSEEPEHHPWGLAWMRLAADNGNEYAALRTATAYRDGIGCKKSEDLTIKYNKIAAKGGYPEAQGQLGLCYWHGVGVEKDHKEAYKWINLCALQGQGLGLHLLGLMTMRGLGCEKNEEEGLRLFHAAAQKGELEAAHEIGECYYFGLGVEKDIAQSAVWYRRGAIHGHAPSMTDLGYLLKEGEGVLCNPREALHWLNKAAKLEDARAMHMLADIYATGIGVEKNLELCRRWMSRAAMRGYRPAKEWMEKHLPPTPKWLDELVNDASQEPSTDQATHDKTKQQSNE